MARRKKLETDNFELLGGEKAGCFLHQTYATLTRHSVRDILTFSKSNFTALIIIDEYLRNEAFFRSRASCWSFK